MISKKQIIITNIGKKSILADVSVLEKSNDKSIVIFCHGYKGFKDWGAWNMVSEYFANEGISFLKFNFSHNGGTLKKPIDFPDLDAFGKNTYSQEMDDLNQVIDYVESNFPGQQIYLIGHSRGGGIATLKAGQDARINKLATWAAVSDFSSRFPNGEQLELWKTKRVMHVLNSRTKQSLPHYYSFYEDFKKNEGDLTISHWCKQIKVPHLILHGLLDEAVPVKEAKFLGKLNPNSKSVFLETNHTFNTKHPWVQKEMSIEMEKVCSETISFFRG